jgi:hypothetical protein
VSFPGTIDLGTFWRGAAPPSEDERAHAMPAIIQVKKLLCCWDRAPAVNGLSQAGGCANFLIAIRRDLPGESVG